MIRDKHLQYVIDWIDRAWKHFGDKHKFMDDECNYLDPGQYATFIARGKHWNESLNSRPDPDGADVAILRQFEKDGYKHLTVKDVI